MKQLTLKFLILALILALNFFCSRKKAAVSSAKLASASYQDSLFTARDSSYAFILPAGDSAYYPLDNDPQIDIRTSNGETLRQDVWEIRDHFDSSRAMVHDSLDLFKGFAVEHAGWGPPFDSPDGDRKTVDSVVQFENPFGVKCLRVKCTYTSFSEGSGEDSIPYEAFYVYLSQGGRIRMVEMLYYQNISEKADVSSRISQSMRFVGKAK